jgi:hypothetical protein
MILKQASLRWSGFLMILSRCTGFQMLGLGWPRHCGNLKPASEPDSEKRSASASSGLSEPLSDSERLSSLAVLSNRDNPFPLATVTLKPIENVTVALSAK